MPAIIHDILTLAGALAVYIGSVLFIARFCSMSSDTPEIWR